MIQFYRSGRYMQVWWSGYDWIIPSLFLLVSLVWNNDLQRLIDISFSPMTELRCHCYCESGWNDSNHWLIFQWTLKTTFDLNTLKHRKTNGATRSWKYYFLIKQRYDLIGWHSDFECCCLVNYVTVKYFERIVNIFT